jgi:subfamily B ATP-binding cassette protein MsbA
MSKNKNTSSDWSIYIRLLSNINGMWYLFFFSICGFFLYSMSQVLVADWGQFVIDTLSGEEKIDSGIVSGIAIRFFGGDKIPAHALNNMILVSIILLCIIRGAGFFMGTYFLAIVSNNIVHRLRCQVFDQILVAPAAYYDTSSTGNLLAKVTYHVSQVTGAATDAIKIIFREGFFAIGLFSYLLYNQWRLTLVFLVVVPVIALIITWAGKQFRRISRRIQNSVGDVNQVAGEAISGYKEVRLFGGKEYEQTRFYNTSAYNMKQSLKMAFLSAISTPVIQLVIWTALAILVWVALDMRTDTTAGQFAAYMAAAALLAKPVRQLTEVQSIIQKGLAASEDLFEFIDSPQEQDTGIKTTQRARGKVEFRNLSFGYGEGDERVLRDINLTVEPGQTVAVVGLSGSGKSTLVGLIPRFYDHCEGQILLDDVEINDYQLDNLRQQIAIVTQSVTLFNNSVFNNIAYGGMSGAPADDVHRAAEAAHAMEFISLLPEGMATLVGEDGVMLSGGQRQRLAIARAILKDAPVLILDEATSSLDNKAEFLIQEALHGVMEDRTSLVIAHRLSTIEKADSIVVLDQGRVVEQGTHEDLLTLGGKYEALYRRNFNVGTDDDFKLA